jgi:hypothetical protein
MRTHHRLGTTKIDEAARSQALGSTPGAAECPPASLIEIKGDAHGTTLCHTKWAIKSDSHKVRRTSRF